MTRPLPLLRALALGALTLSVLSGCADRLRPDFADAPAPETPAEIRETAFAEPSQDVGTAVPSDPPAGQRASAPAVTAPAPAPATSPAGARPAPERPAAAPAPRPAPPVEPAPAPGETAEAFWARFLAALRAQDRAAIEAGLAPTVVVNGEPYARDAPEAQGVVEALVENELVREALLEAPALTHGARGEAAFDAVVRYALNGETVEVRLSGGLAEVAPGDWRLARVETRM
jgi:hypothetical protein